VDPDVGSGAVRPLDAVIEDGFWAGRRRLNREVLIPEGERRLEAAGNFENLRVAAGRRRGAYRGPLYLDSDLYKWLEAVGWERRNAPSPALERMARDTVALLEEAQCEDGYLNSYYQVARPRERFSNLAWDHELYCAGHLIQAAIALGDERAMGVARRFADLLVRERPGPDGHPEIELALAALSRATGEGAYLELARELIDARGHGRLQPAGFGPEYFQDRVPVREQTVMEGHAVRALYLACGAVDVGDPALLDAVREQWRDMAFRKAYVTGALGARAGGEAFGEPYELPPDRCYGETCAAIASVMLNWRLLLATGDPRCAELLERTLYNGVLAGVALDGSGYSYVNPLQVRDDAGAWPRYPWFECACCPPNVMRLLASLHRYLATEDDGGVQVHQYASGRCGPVRVRTEYPWDGRVEVEALEGGRWTLTLRVPSWGTTRLDGDVVAPGYARLERSWRAGERVVLELDMTPRRAAAHHRIDAVRGCQAIERGPFVYCLEGADAPGRLDDLALTGEPRAVARPDLLGGIVAVEAPGVRRAAPGGWPYGPPADDGGEPVTLLAVPYAQWGNRGAGPMRVWIPVSP